MKKGMKEKQVGEFCKEVYTDAYNQLLESLLAENGTNLEQTPKNKLEAFEAIAQKYAIKHSIISSLESYPDSDPASVWKSIYGAHVHRKSGVEDIRTITNVISADQSWKKSSGHAFEEMIKDISAEVLQKENINFVLQRDLTKMLDGHILANEKRDLEWLRKRVDESVFDLYAITEHNNKSYCFGCIQCKTSIRDRVTRDREPSIDAMGAFFWSIAIVLDGSFLKMPKFISMVNGGGTEHRTNGWHGLYVFTSEKETGRIYRTDITFKKLKDHAVKAGRQWLTQRQWLDSTWNPEI